jgi:hypothetical protein
MSEDFLSYHQVMELTLPEGRQILDRRIEATRRNVERFKEAIARHKTEERPADVHPTLWELERNAMESQLGSLEIELQKLITKGEEYDRDVAPSGSKG